MHGQQNIEICTNVLPSIMKANKSAKTRMADREDLIGYTRTNFQSEHRRYRNFLKSLDLEIEY